MVKLASNVKRVPFKFGTWRPVNLYLYRHISPIVAVVYSPDGQQLVSASMDQRIKVWDVKTGECLRKLEGHTKWIYTPTFTFLPGDDSIHCETCISSSGDRTIRLGHWNG